MDEIILNRLSLFCRADEVCGQPFYFVFFIPTSLKLEAPLSFNSDRKSAKCIHTQEKKGRKEGTIYIYVDEFRPPFFKLLSKVLSVLQGDFFTQFSISIICFVVKVGQGGRECFVDQRRQVYVHHVGKKRILTRHWKWPHPASHLCNDQPNGQPHLTKPRILPLLNQITIPYERWKKVQLIGKYGHRYLFRLNGRMQHRHFDNWRFFKKF